jgi:YVTN family beta-propeller protein
MTVHRVVRYCFILALCLGSGARAGEPFVNFESGHVRPLALSPSRSLLFAVNTPDNRLEVFRVTDGGLVRAGETLVGLEPVAVQARTEGEVYVVNHLSDSVSVVDVSDPRRPFVKATLLVGDEPRDVAIGGPAHDRIFITTAHRGQNNPRDPQLTTPGVGRADVWVFYASDLTHERTVLTLFTDTPRALAVSADGSRVYAAGFHSGNQTTALNQIAVATDSTSNNLIKDGFTGLGMPAPTAIQTGPDAGTPAPATGIIVKWDAASGRWKDSAGRDWTGRVRFNLPDKDVFTIDATQDPPVAIASVSHAGTILFNLAVSPATGKVYASNLESQNHLRFEPKVQGHIAESRVTIIDGASLRPVHLNPHIDYSTPSGPPAEIEASLAFPLGMEFAGDGKTLYVAAFGSGKVGVLDEEAAVLARIPVGGGPTGLALDEPRGKLYVMNRFDSTISIVDTGARAQVAVVPLRFDPEPPAVRRGRPVLYDARASGHGDSACASCHIFGDFDSLAWDLGDPGGVVQPNPLVRVVDQGSNALSSFHPMKGPMTTQSLRGMEGAGAMHWRGDRNGVTGGEAAPDVFDAGQAFLQFRPAFQSLLGKATELPLEDMEKFRDFILTVSYPPNPNAAIDGTLTAQQSAGKTILLSSGSRTGTGGDGDRCIDCHTLPRGTDGHGSFELETQDFKVAHLRNLYQKVGMFGTAVPFIESEPIKISATPTPGLGDQVRGFGFLHDGSVPTLFNFLRIPILPIPPFTFPDQPGLTGVEKVRQLESFLLTFPTGLAPVVGHQVTLAATTGAAALARYQTFRDRADAGDCDLTAQGMIAGAARGFLWMGAAGGGFQSDRAAEKTSENDLLAAISGGAVITFTAVPPGGGPRIALDRDGDGAYDRDELDAGSDPADPASIPTGIKFLRGNCNGDSGVDLSDAVFALFRLFEGGGAPPCAEACDSNGDAAFDLADPVFTLDFLFLGGPPPGSYPSCDASGGQCEVGACP